MGGDEAQSPAADERKIPPLNPEDPLSGLTDEQIKESLATFGKNEVRIYCMICLTLWLVREQKKINKRLSIVTASKINLFDNIQQ
jgi:hypothetical protein